MIGVFYYFDDVLYLIDRIVDLMFDIFLEEDCDDVVL